MTVQELVAAYELAAEEMNHLEDEDHEAMVVEAMDLIESRLDVLGYDFEGERLPQSEGIVENRAYYAALVQNAALEGAPEMLALEGSNG